jgi:hypothetical protein
MRSPASFALAIFALCFAPRTASAQPIVAPAAAANPAEEEENEATKPFSAAALAGFGFSEGPDSQGIGFGARAGYLTTSGIYLGATAVYHLGGRPENKVVTAKEDEARKGATDINDAKAFYVGGEVGLNLAVGPLVMRPYAGLGVHVVRTHHKEAAPENVVIESDLTDIGPYIAPGFTALYPLFGGFFAGIDTRYVITPFESGARGVSLFATVGKGF